VNAALRNLTRSRHKIHLPTRPDDPLRSREAALDYLAITLSHPRWLAARWLDRLGFEATERAFMFNNGPAPLTLRANTLRASRQVTTDRLAEDGVETTATAYAPEGLVVRSGHPLSLRWAADGLFVAQDEVSQLVPLLAGAASADRVLDACAAPGGKTLVLAAAVGNEGRVVSSDVRPARVALLRQMLARAGALNRVTVVQADAAAGLPFRGVFDRVLVDAPCSGLGVLRREADIRWRRTPEDFGPLSAVQLAIVRHAAEAVRPGGCLVYSTCSTEPEENEDVIAAFLAEAPSFGRARATDVRATLPEAARELVDCEGVFRTAPWQRDLEGFYAVVLARKP
jgi:16S rRNA (cytosine967-C5)-methyltransferase